MQQIAVDPGLGQKLAAAVGQVALCDDQGRVLGLFLPLQVQTQFNDLQLEPPLSVAETERLRANNRTGRPLEEILSRLGH